MGKDVSDPRVNVPMSVFGDTFFIHDYARLGRWVHMWTFAVWKTHTKYLPIDNSDRDPATIEFALYCGWLIRDRDGTLRLTGPDRNPKWLRNVRRRDWQTYVIEAIDQGLVKIGKSYNAERRIDALQTASPHKLRTIVVFNADLERWLHEQLDADRVNGEWFRYSDRVRDVIFSLEVT